MAKIKTKYNIGDVVVVKDDDYDEPVLLKIVEIQLKKLGGEIVIGYSGTYFSGEDKGRCSVVLYFEENGYYPKEWTILRKATKEDWNEK